MKPLIFFNLTFFPMHNLGLAGMMRRISDPTKFEHLISVQPINQFVTLSAFTLGISQFLFIFNLFYSLRRGRSAEANPWRSNTLEWSTVSPPPPENFATLPIVDHGPYEYSVPDLDSDFLPQARLLSAAEKSAIQIQVQAQAHSHS